MPETAETDTAEAFPQIGDEARQAATAAMSALTYHQRLVEPMHRLDQPLYPANREALLALLEMAACPVVCDGHRPTPEQVADGKTDWHVLCQEKAAAAFAALDRRGGL